MEWKIFIKALVSTGLVVSISILNVFALSLATGSGGASCKGLGWVQSGEASKVCSVLSSWKDRLKL